MEFPDSTDDDSGDNFLTKMSPSNRSFQSDSEIDSRFTFKSNRIPDSMDDEDAKYMAIIDGAVKERPPVTYGKIGERERHSIPDALVLQATDADND